MQVRVHVDKPVEHCYRIWLDRLNYLNWFDLISEVLLGHWLTSCETSVLTRQHEGSKT